MTSVELAIITTFKEKRREKKTELSDLLVQRTERIKHRRSITRRREGNTVVKERIGKRGKKRDTGQRRPRGKEKMPGLL